VRGYVEELREAIEHATPILRHMTEEASRRHPAPGKWCPREVIGRLIDLPQITISGSCAHSSGTIWSLMVMSRMRGYRCSGTARRRGTS